MLIACTCILLVITKHNNKNFPLFRITRNQVAVYWSAAFLFQNTDYIVGRNKNVSREQLEYNKYEILATHSTKRRTD